MWYSLKWRNKIMKIAYAENQYKQSTAIHKFCKEQAVRQQAGLNAILMSAGEKGKRNTRKKKQKSVYLLDRLQKKYEKPIIVNKSSSVQVGRNL